jgi:S-adenosylmethionine decarboxylase
LHLIIDGFDADKSHISSLETIRLFLEKYPRIIGMTPISLPRVLEYHGKHPKDWGLSGFVLIAESHISIHTFPEKKYLNVDIFSCKTFDEAKAEIEVADAFKIKSVESRILKRGIEYLSADHGVSNVLSERENITSD